MTKPPTAPAFRRVLLTVPRLCAAGVLLSPLAMAENEQTLDDLIVSALRFPNEAGKTTAAVTVLNPEELKERGIYDLTTALSEVPGVIATSTGGQQGAIGGLFIRGTTTAYSQVVVDGMRLSDSTAPLGNFLGTARIDDLSRIEVLRGPQSAIYGGEAVGGVVWLETARGAGEPNGSVRLEGGSFDSFNGYSSANGKTGDVSWFFGGGYDTTANDQPNNDWDQSRAAVRVEWQANPDVILGTTIRANDSRYENQGGSIDHLDGLLATTYADVKFNEVWSARFHAGFYDERYDSDASWGNFGTDLQRASVSTDHVFTLNDQHKLLWGAFYEDTDFSNTIGVDEEHDRYGTYLGWEWSPVDRVTTDAVVRWEDYASYGDEVTWRTGAAWKIPVVETTLRGGIGRAFRTPTFLDLFGTAFGPGNPNLDAESAIGWDIGLEKEWLKNHHVGVTWFSNAIEDQIFNSFAFPPVPPVNVGGTSHTEGLESALHGSFLDGEWSYRLAWTVLTMSLRDQPRHSGSASIDWRPTDKWLLGAGGFYLDKRGWGGQRVDDAFVARVYGEYQLTKQVRLTGRLENVFNSHWEYSRFGFSGPVEAPGFGAFAGVKIDW
jgi:vitamin B12 transporter